jgi:signal transduction histidine kinase
MSAVPSTANQLWVASLAFIAVFLVSYGADLFVVGHPRWMLTDDLIVSVLAALVVYRYERERSRVLSEKLRVIREMNAFVRNELQIVYASLERPDKMRVSTIERSVARIDWALRELLPGKEAVGPRQVGDRGGDAGTAERSA